MATFESLPLELLHLVAHYFAPRSCSDDKADILAFRLLKKSTWLVANRHAFKYMTLYVDDAEKKTPLGLFGQFAKIDSTGFDVQCSVQEIRFKMPPELREVSRMAYSDMSRMDGFRNAAKEVFSSVIIKKGMQLDKHELAVARESYWKLFVEPYMSPQIEDVRQFRHSHISLNLRCEEDLAYFPNVYIASTDMEDDVALDKNSEAYQALDGLDLVDVFWNKKNRRLVSFYKSTTGKVVAMATPVARQVLLAPLIVYNEHSHQAATLISSLPKSITQLNWLSYHLGLGHWQNSYPTTTKVLSASVTHLETIIDPLDRNWQSFQKELSFPNLRTLHLWSGINRSTPRSERIRSCITRRNELLPQILPFLTSPHLTTLQIKDYALVGTGWRSLLQHSMSHNLTLRLENITFVHAFPDDLDENILRRDDTTIMTPRWHEEIQFARAHIPAYVTSGLVSLHGTFRTVHFGEGPAIVHEQVVHERVVGLLDVFMRTGMGENEVVTELSSDACSSVCWEVPEMDEDAFWR